MLEFECRSYTDLPNFFKYKMAASTLCLTEIAISSIVAVNGKCCVLVFCFNLNGKWLPVVVSRSLLCVCSMCLLGVYAHL